MRRNIEALLLYLEQRGPMPHAWGDHANDCISFANGAVKAQTRRSPIGRLSWKNERQALALLKRHGGIEAILDARFERIAPAQAHRGDLGAIADERFGLHPVLVEGRTLCSPGDRGLKRCPRAALVAAWDITRPKKVR